jgi:WD40 repeat protein
MTSASPSTKVVLAVFLTFLLCAADCGGGVSLHPGGAGGAVAGGTGGTPSGLPTSPCGQLGMGSARSLAYSPDGTLVAVAYGAGALVLYNAGDGTLARRLSGHDSGANSVVFSGDGALLASGGDDGLVKLWRVTDGSLVWSGRGDTLGGVSSVAFSAGSTLVASTGIAGVLAVWNAADGTRAWSLPLGESQQTVFFHVDASNVESVVSHPYGGPTVRFRGLSDGTVIKELTLDDAVRLGGISPDGHLLGYVDSPLGHAVVAFNADDGRQLWRVADAHSDNIAAVRSWSGVAVASAAADGTIKLWAMNDGTPLRTIVAPGPVADVAFSPDGTSIAGGMSAGNVEAFRVADGAPLAIVPTPAGQSGNIFQVTYSADGALLASAALGNGSGADRSIKIWRVSDGALLRTFDDGGGQTTQAAAFSPDGTLVVSADATDGRAHVRRVSDGTEVISVGANGWSAHGVAFSADGATVAAGCRCSGPAFFPVRMWTLDGTEGVGVGDPGTMAAGFAFSPDGATIAVGQSTLNGMPSVTLWRLGDHSKLWGMTLQPDMEIGGASVAFSPDGTTIAVTTLFGANLAVLRASDGATLRATSLTLGARDVFAGAVTFSSDGALLAIATSAGLEVLRTGDWSLAGTLAASTNFIGAAFSPVARRLAAAGPDGVIYQWCDLGL